MSEPRGSSEVERRERKGKERRSGQRERESGAAHVRAGLGVWSMCAWGACRCVRGGVVWVRGSVMCGCEFASENRKRENVDLRM